MPYDGTNYKLDVLLIGLPGMAQIAEGLRSDFSNLLAWDFNFPLVTEAQYRSTYPHRARDNAPLNCGYLGCGVGYAHQRWPRQVKKPSLEKLAVALQLSQDEIGAVFGYIGMPKYYPGKLHDDITPLMVADAIDTFIADKGGIFGT